MRISLLSAVAVMATLALAPVANAMPQDLRSPDARDAARGHVWQDLRSPDARDADNPTHAQILQDRARLNAGNPLNGRWLATERYYSSYGKAKPVQHAAPTADDDSPWLVIGIGLAVIALVAGLVAVATRTRRRSMRVAV